MEKKNSSRNRKKWIIIGIAAALAILLLVILILICRKDSGESKNDGSQTQTAQDWDNRIADLENEPVSDLDVVYKDGKKNKNKPYLIQVNKSQNTIIIYKKGSNGKYTEPYKAMICSVGFDTPTGEFSTSDKYEWKIVNGNVWTQYATRITGNVLFHSMPYAANSKDTLITKYYNQLGSTLSASCIRLSALDAQWIMKNCPSGTKVQIYESEADEPMERPQAITVTEDTVWDPTDPDPANPYHSVQIGFEGVEASKKVERGTQINYMDGITIRDTCGNDLSSQVKVVTDLDSFRLGTYNVKYTVTDAAGKKAEAATSYEIVDTAPPEFSGLNSILRFDSVADVTQENVLKGVTVIDNNEILDNSRISVVIPAVMEGNNTITLSVADDYGNTTTTTVTASVYVKPPVISLKAGAETIIPLTQVVDQTYALSRVTASSDDKILDDKITVAITRMEWGYAFRYTVTDENGYVGILNDSVSYVQYSITVPQDLNITNINDRTQLLKGVQLRDNLGNKLNADGVDVSAKKLNGNQYQLVYRYTYTSPLGSRTAVAEIVVTVEGAAATEEPQTTQTPSTESPERTENPEGSDSPQPTQSAATQQPSGQNQ